MRGYSLVAVAIFLIMAISADAQNVQNTGETDGLGGYSMYVNAGFSHVYTDVESNWTSGDPRWGWDWQAGLEWNNSRGLGVGFLYSGYISTGKEHYLGVHYSESMMLNYFAPQFLFNWYRPDSRWDFFVKAGLGLILISERSKVSQSGRTAIMTKCGLGSNVTLGAEFKVNRRLGIIASLSGVNAFVHQDNSAYDMPDGNGMARVSLNLGVKLHL